MPAEIILTRCYHSSSSLPSDYLYRTPLTRPLLHATSELILERAAQLSACHRGLRKSCLMD